MAVAEVVLRETVKSLKVVKGDNSVVMCLLCNHKELNLYPDIRGKKAGHGSTCLTPAQGLRAGESPGFG